MQTEAELQETMARCRRRILRIKQLQARLNTRLVAAQVVHEKASRTLWERQNGYTLLRNADDVTEQDAVRLTAIVATFYPMRKPSNR